MMREIKFRVCLKDYIIEHCAHKKILYVVNSIDFDKKIVCIILNCGNGIDPPLYSYFSFNDVELMQYTGIEDKDCKNVYEGDIVIFDTIFDTMENNCFSKAADVWTVEFDSGNFIIKLQGVKDTFIAHNLGMIRNSIRIIGNIYDNPELLNKENKDA